MKSLFMSLVLSMVFAAGASSWAAAKSCVMEVGNMTCEACEESVAGELKKLPEVASAEVDHATGKAKITFKDGKSAPEAKLAEAVRKAGFLPGKVTMSK